MCSKSGFTVWLTGFSGSGKSTLARLVYQELAKRSSQGIEVVDAEVVRSNLWKELGFSKEGRDANVRRIGWICQLLTKHGITSLVAAISPYRETRNEVPSND